MIQVINKKQGSPAFGRIETATYFDLKNEWFLADGWELYESPIDKAENPNPTAEAMDFLNKITPKPELPQDIESSGLMDFTNIPDTQSMVNQPEESEELQPLNTPLEAAPPKPKAKRKSRAKVKITQ